MVRDLLIHHLSLYAYRAVSLGKSLSINLYNTILLASATSTAGEYAVSTLSFPRVGIYNLTIRYPGSNIYESAELNITVIVMYRINLTLNITYHVLTNGSILFKLEDHLYIEGKPSPN